jgi:hypothetical protein
LFNSAEYNAYLKYVYMVDMLVFNKLVYNYRLRDGLQTLDVLTYIQEHYKAFKDLFVCQGNEKLTAEMMEVVFMDIKMSVPGSNRRRDEENIVGYWRDFLIDLQGTCKIYASHLLFII